MKKRIKARWIKALRSGDYSQVQDYLWADGYCCMGVLADVGKFELAGVFRMNASCDYEYYDTEVQSFEQLQSEELPSIALELVGLTPDEQALLIRMNDSGALFDQIADYIEENL
jgi:hypothetical protein